VTRPDVVRRDFLRLAGLGSALGREPANDRLASGREEDRPVRAADPGRDRGDRLVQTAPVSAAAGSSSATSISPSAGAPRIDKWGLFLHYLARNLAIVTSSLPYYTRVPRSFQINTHGLALWFTTPVYLWLFGRAPDFVWRSLAWSVVPSSFSAHVPKQRVGSNSATASRTTFAVFLFAMMATGGYRFGRRFTALALWGVAVNAVRALTFERRGSERFYTPTGPQADDFPA